MTKRKKVMRAVLRHVGRGGSERLDVVEGSLTRPNVVLVDILANAELDVSFVPPVSPHFSGDLMFLYEGREVYVEQKEEALDRRVFYHGTLEIDVMNERSYAVSYGDTGHKDKLYFSKVLRMIVVRG
jgi:hypothetical protein